MSQSKPVGRWLLSSGKWAVVNKFLTAISAFLVNALLTRLLSPEDVGTYYLIFGIVAFALLLCLFGTQQGVVRLVSASQAAVGEISTRGALKSCLTIVLFSTALVTTAYALIVGPLLGRNLLDSEYVATLSAITAAWIALRAAQTFLAQSFRGFKRIDFASTFEGTASGLILMSFLLALYALQWEVDLELILTLTVIALFIAVAASGLFLAGIVSTQTESGGATRVGYALTICTPLLVASLCLQGFSELHIGILGYFSHERELAQYGVAFRLSKFVILPLVVVNSIIPPMISQFYHMSKTDEAEKLLRLTATLSSIPTLLIVLGIIMFGEDILGLVFGEFYRGGATVLIILLCGQLVNSMTGSPGILLAMANRQKVVMVSALFSGILGIVLSLFLAPNMAAVGVAIGVAVSTASHNVVMWIYSNRKLGVRTHLKSSDAKLAIRILLNPRELKAMLGK